MSNLNGHLLVQFLGDTPRDVVSIIDSSTRIEMSVITTDGTCEKTITKLAQGLIEDDSPLDTYGEDGNPEYDRALDLLTEKIGVWADSEAAALGTEIDHSDSADGALYYYFTTEYL